MNINIEIGNNLATAVEVVGFLFFLGIVAVCISRISIARNK